MRSSVALSPAKRKRIAQRFDAAMRLQRAGKLHEAEQGLVKVIDSDPTHAPALHCLALLVHRRGERDQAIALMQRAVRGHDADASVFNNLANMLRESGCGEQAIAVYRQAIQHDAANLNAQFNLANALLESGDGVGAQACFEVVLRATPHDPAALNGLGFALLAQGDTDGALAQFQLLVVASPGEAAAHINLARVLRDADRAVEALSAVQKGLNRIADDVSLIAFQADVQMSLGAYQDAERSYRRLRQLSPDDPQPYTGLIRSLTAQHRELEALATSDEYIARYPNSADGYACKGIVLKHLGQTTQAVSAFERAVAIEPSFAESWNNLGMMSMDLGDMARAQEYFQRALALQPDAAQTLFNVIRTRRNTEADRDELQRLEQLSGQASRPAEDRVSLHFALGKAFDDLRESDRAFAHYEQANALHRRTAPFDESAFVQWSQALHYVFDPAFFERTAGFGSPSERPVFIVGMPRSGTSLVEQILASHPQVFGADELPNIIDLAQSLHTRIDGARAYPYAAAGLTKELAIDLARDYLEAINALDSQSTYVTDKMPSNFFHLGLIAAMLPNARIIHCVRDPMDSCFSNFIQLFGDLHHYSYSLQSIAVFYNEYRRIMAHWNAVLPLPMHTVSYEAVVDDPRLEARAMLDFLQLPFDESCVEFHRTERVVTTASHWQVRQPIYRSSRQRWRRYEDHLRELAAAIGYDIESAAESPGDTSSA